MARIRAHNKIIAYGCDSAYWFEHSVGDFVLTRMTLATVLADRINAGEITESRAVELARMMLFQSAADLYGLGDVIGDLEYC